MNTLDKITQVYRIHSSSWLFVIEVGSEAHTLLNDGAGLHNAIQPFLFCSALDQSKT